MKVKYFKLFTHKALSLFVAFIFIYSNGHSQQLIEKNDNFYFHYKVNLEKGINKICVENEFTALAIEMPLADAFQNLTIYNISGESYKLSQNDDAENKNISNLLKINQESGCFEIYSEWAFKNIDLYFYYSKLQSPALDNFSLRANCEKPEMVDQDVWRVGLPLPGNGIETTTTNHIIIHHSAGSNNNPDHLNVVREIYLYHTQSLGWRDIGYNFLIASDGTIYAGRDGMNLIDDDNVKGAHFCGKNSNTMGICVLGLFNTEFPKDSALKSLNDIITWKLFKEYINPLSSSHHPVGSPSGYNLPVIAGHRDGCATLCPGDSLYALIEGIRQEVLIMMQDCGFSSISENEDFDLYIYPNPVISGKIYISSEEDIQNIEISDLNGKVAFSDNEVNTRDMNIDTEGFEKGVYFLRCQFRNKVVTQKIIIQ